MESESSSPYYDPENVFWEWRNISALLSIAQPQDACGAEPSDHPSSNNHQSHQHPNHVAPLLPFPNPTDESS